MKPLSLVPSLILLVLLTGCGGSAGSVSGRITCNGKAVSGAIMFSPKGEGAANTGPAVEVKLNSDGRYTAKLQSVGKHRVLIKPSDIVFPAEPGQEYPCDLTPFERDLKAGSNEISIEMSKRD